jgi:hypothetical protein
MRLTVGGVTYDATKSDEHTRRLVTAHWPEFMTSARQGGRVVRLDAHADPSLLEREAPHGDVSVRRAGRSWQIERLDYLAELDPERGEARVRHGGEIPFLSSCLRVLTSLVLAEREGLLLHASSVHADRGVIVFPGPSGTGKTTIARLGAPRGVLSDEVTAIAVENGSVHAHPTPFWGDMRRKTAAGSGPVAEIVFVRSGEPTERRRLSSAEAMFRLAPNVLGFPEDDAHQRALIDTASAVVRLVPAFELTFRLPANPWPLLDEAS